MVVGHCEIFLGCSGLLWMVCWLLWVACFGATQRTSIQAQNLTQKNSYISPFFTIFSSPKTALYRNSINLEKKTIKAHVITKNPTIYIITKFSLHHFLIIFLGQNWCFIERFINHTSYNPQVRFNKDTKEKKHINYSIRHRAKKLMRHFNREQAKNQKYWTLLYNHKFLS